MKHFTKILIFLILGFSNILSAQTSFNLVEAKYEKAIRRLEFAKDVEFSFPDQNARSLLNEAASMLDNAKSYLDANRILLANRSIDSANLLIDSALRTLLANPIRRQREKLIDLLQHAESIIIDSGNKKAEQLLRNAKDHQTKAAESYQQQQYQLALEHFRLAFFLVNKAIEVAENENKNSEEQVRDEKERLDQLLNKARDAVAGGDNSSAKQLLQLAEKQILKIQSAVLNKNYATALDHYHKATRLLLRVIDISSGKEEKLAVIAYDDVIALDDLIERIEQKIEQSPAGDNSRLSLLLDRIYELQQKAHDALEINDYQVAQFNVQMARNVIERIMQITEKNPADQSQTRIMDELSQLKLNLEEIASIVNESQNQEAKILLDLAYKAQNQAQTLFERRRLQLALGAITISNKFAFAAEKIALEPESEQTDKNTIKMKLERIEQQITNYQSKKADMPPISILLLNEADKMYKIASDSYNQNLYVVAKKCSEIAQRYLSKILAP